MARIAQKNVNVRPNPPPTYDSGEIDDIDVSTVAGQQRIQRGLLIDLYQAVSALEQAVAPVTNRLPTMASSERISPDNAKAVSPVVDELALRNDFIRSITEDVNTITGSLTL